jgi:hypothetical protein
VVDLPGLPAMSKVGYSGELRRGASAELPKVIKPALKSARSAELGSYVGSVDPSDPTRTKPTPARLPLQARFSGELNDEHHVVQMDSSSGRNHSSSQWQQRGETPSPASGPNPWNMSSILRAARGDSSSAYSLNSSDSYEQEQMVEVMLDVGQDGVMLRSVMPRDSHPSVMSHSEATILVEGLQRQSTLQKQPSLGLKQSASIKVRQLSQELKKLSRTGSRVLSAKFSPDYDAIGSTYSPVDPTPVFPISTDTVTQPLPGPRRPLTRAKSSAEHALHGLRFIHKATGTTDQQSQWEAVKARFHSLKNEDGLLPRDKFCVCIGVYSLLLPEDCSPLSILPQDFRVHWL